MREKSRKVEEADGIYTFDEKKKKKKEQERVQIVRNEKKKEKEKKDRQHDMQLDGAVVRVLIILHFLIVVVHFLHV